MPCMLTSSECGYMAAEQQERPYPKVTWTLLLKSILLETMKIHWIRLCLSGVAGLHSSSLVCPMHCILNGTTPTAEMLSFNMQWR